MATEWAMVTPYGVGVDVCRDGLLDGRTALSRTDQFYPSRFQSPWAGQVEGLADSPGVSRVEQMLERLFATGRTSLPPEARLLL
ncbi:MAG: hypothetical protein U1E27_07030, partial [Kiritimatiellia bacterium]|nr:hypothetical protein [Kiritimatiellia bacterium]